MPVAVAPAQRSHKIFSNTFRGRNRAVSEASPPPPPTNAPAADQVKLPKAASYTYFPRVKDLDDASQPIVELKGTISEEDLQNGKNGSRTSDSSESSSPASDDGPESEALQMPQRRPTTSSRRSSRFLSFSSKSREPSVEPKPDGKSDRGRNEAGKQTQSPAESPARSLTKLRRKSWIVSQQQDQQSRSGSSPTRQKHNEKKEERAKKNQVTNEVNKRKTPTSATSIPEEVEARDTNTSDLQQPTPLNKKNKRLSGLFTPAGDIPAAPAIPTSFSTEKLPLTTQLPSPINQPSVPPIPRNISAEKLKGVKTEPRKKDELWTVFRTLDADLRK